MTNINQAISWLSKGDSIAWKDGQFLKCDTLEKVKRFCIPGREAKEIEAIAQSVRKHLVESSAERQEFLHLADLLITNGYSSLSTNKVIAVFERSIVRYQETPSFKSPRNAASFQKWIKYGMPAHIYYKHPEFSAFIEDSQLLSQMKVTKDTVLEVDGEAAILVNGQPMKWPQLKETFEIQYSNIYKELFVIHKETRHTYTYLDNGLGLQQHHPFVTGLAPISKLNAHELKAVAQKAAEFVRPGEEHLSAEERNLLNSQRSHVIQLVSSYVRNSNSRFDELVRNPSHPYLRIISEGDVFEVGYRPKEKIMIPFETLQGQFRSPDCSEYIMCDERVVTNIPISPQEATDLYRFTLRYHRDGINLGNSIAFHLFRQNCSTYVRMALHIANIQVPTEMTLPSLVQEIAPEWIRKIGQGFKAVKDVTHLCLKKITKTLLPVPVKHALHCIANKITALFQRMIVSMAALGLAPIGIVLGGTLGNSGRAFVPVGAPEGRIDPPLKNWRNWFNLSGYRVNLPGVLQRWQRAQASTVLYKTPIKLVIVP